MAAILVLFEPEVAAIAPFCPPNRKPSSSTLRSRAP